MERKRKNKITFFSYFRSHPSPIITKLCLLCNQFYFVPSLFSIANITQDPISLTIADTFNDKIEELQ